MTSKTKDFKFLKLRENFYFNKNFIVAITPIEEKYLEDFEYGLTTIDGNKWYIDGKEFKKLKKELKLK